MIRAMTVHLSTGADVELAPASSLGELWYLKSWHEAGKAGLSAGNFTAITLQPEPKDGLGGQSCWVQLGQLEIAWIKLINATSVRTWKWADENKTGTLYLGTHDNENLDTSVRWPRIALGSPDTANLALRNVVRVMERSGHYCRIAGIPKSADYTGMAARLGMVHSVYIVYPDGHTGEMPYYRMPLFDPASGFKISLGGQGLWLDEIWLHSRV